jgi:hypothetical protein
VTQYPDRIIPTEAGPCAARGCRQPVSADQQRLLVSVDELEPATPRWAVKGADLCEWHVRHFAAILADLVGLVRDVEVAVASPAPAPDGAGKVDSSTLRDIGDMWNPQASYVLAHIRDWTRSVVHVVLTDRPLPAPVVHEWARVKKSWLPTQRTMVRQVDTATHGVGMDDHPRLQLAALAKHHARWLALYPTLGAAWLEDVVHHRTMARKAVDAPKFRRVGMPGQHCSVIEWDADLGPVECHGPLSAILRDPDAGVLRSQVLCSTNPAHAVAVEDAHDWMAYAG